MLKGKVAVITGSTSGIGLGIARALAKQGCHIMLNGLGDQETIHRAIKTIKDESQAEVAFCEADVSQAQECHRLIDEAVRSFSSLDILVNNAGVQYVAPVEDFPIDQWEKIIQVNLSSAFYLCRKALPVMRKNNWGRIINIASVHGLVASEGKSAYVASKHGIIGLTKVIALETAQSFITCNAICPGWVHTPLVEKQIDAQAKEQNISLNESAKRLIQEKQPSLEFVTVEQIGEATVFLALPAASQMTGTTLTIDGGWTAR